jgi:RNA polymerase sigma factor (sigma-70 family)
MANHLELVLGHIRKLIGNRSVEDEDDCRLLARFASQRDETAFEAVLRRHGPMVLGVCRRILRDEHVAEDAFQATFLVLARRAAAVPWRESVASWLYTVAQRIALKARIQNNRRRACETEILDMPTAEAKTEGTCHDLRPLLDEELGRLPQKYREPIVLCYLEGKTYDEAARQIGCPAGTVSGRLARARDLLRSRLSRRGLALPSTLLAEVLIEQAAPAAISNALLRSTLRVAALTPAAPGACPAVTALAEGTLQTVGAARWQWAAGLLLSLSMLGAGAGVAAYRTMGDARASSASLPSDRDLTALVKTDGKARSEPVRVNGVDFEVVTDARWLVPVPGKSTQIALGLRVTNRTDRELTFNLSDTFTLDVRNANGKALGYDYSRWGSRRVPQLRLAAGRSDTVSWPGQLQWREDGETLQLTGMDPSGGTWIIAGVRPGTCAVRWRYQTTERPNDLWVGKVETKAARVEVVAPPASKGIPARNIAVVKSLKELAAQPPIDLGGGVTLRLGIEARSAPRWSGVLLYGLTEGYQLPEDETVRSRRLGPASITWRFEDVPERREPIHQVGRQLPKDTRASRLLFCQALQVDRAGTFTLKVRNLKGALLAASLVKSTEERFHSWMPWQPWDGRTKPTETESGPVFPVANRGDGIALPRWEGDQPLIVEGTRNGKEVRMADELPTLVPARLSAGFKVERKGKELWIESDEEMRLDHPERHFLMRWWVNDRPFLPEPLSEDSRRDGGGRVLQGKSLGLRLDFDPEKLGAKKGDAIGLQLLHCPKGWISMTGPAVERESLRTWAELPRLSKRLDFKMD